MIQSDIENLIIESKYRLIPKLIRLGFHDCVGECDGCVDMGNKFNEGLDIPINALNNIVQKYTADQFTGFSRADVWALAATTAANMSQSTLDFPFSWIGRVDCKDKATKGPSREMPSSDFKTIQVLEYFQRNFEFNESQIVALMGGHNLGSAHLDISGFNGSWVHQNITLTNRYYFNLADPNWTQEKNNETKKWQWNNQSGLMMLNSDVALVREFEVEEGDAEPGKASCPFVPSVENNSTCPFANLTNIWVEQYKSNETLWLHDFRDVFAQMLLNGYNNKLCNEQQVCRLTKKLHDVVTAIIPIPMMLEKIGLMIIIICQCSPAV